MNSIVSNVLERGNRIMLDIKSMSKEFKRQIYAGEEIHFLKNDREYCLNGIEDSESYIMNVTSSDNQLIWQGIGRSVRESADKFFAEFVSA